METPFIVGKRLKSIRLEKQLSLDEVSKLTDVSKPMLGQIERGQSSPTITTLWKIAVGLKIPLSSLLEEKEKEMAEAAERQAAAEGHTEEQEAGEGSPAFTMSM